MASHVAALIHFYFKKGKDLKNIEVMEAPSQDGFALLYRRVISGEQLPILIRVSTTGTQMEDRQLKKKYLYNSWLESLLIRSARHVCTHTEAHREEICTDLGLKPARMAVIPHGMSLPDLSASSVGRERFVLTVGRFEPRKGTDTLLKAIPLVMAQMPDCRFVFAGGGGMAELWRRKFLEEHGRLADCVRFLGRVPVDELETLYQACDFLVSPALYESFGMTYLEAMRHGKPVIGCLKSGGAEEVIGDGGLLVRQGDATHLAEAIIRLWADRGLHGELSSRARLRAEYYSLELKAERTERHFAKMIAGEI